MFHGPHVKFPFYLSHFRHFNWSPHCDARWISYGGEFPYCGYDHPDGGPSPGMIAPKGEAAMDWMEYQCQALGGIYHPGQACQDPGPD